MDDYQNAQEKIFVLQQDFDLVSSDLKSQKQKFDQTILDSERSKNKLIEEIELLKESERRLQQMKVQNEHLTGKLDDYYDTQKKLSDQAQEIKELEEANSKMSIELQEKQRIGDAVDYLKESNIKGVTKLFQKE